MQHWYLSLLAVSGEWVRLAQGAVPRDGFFYYYTVKVGGKYEK
jgi:hypothetical protein